METYLVVARGTVTEKYLVEATSAQEAFDKFADGELVFSESDAMPINVQSLEVETEDDIRELEETMAALGLWSNR